MMKQLLMVILIGLFLAGSSVVLWGNSSSTLFGDGIYAKFYKTTNNNVFGHRGGIYSQTGEELYAAWPSTFNSE